MEAKYNKIGINYGQTRKADKYIVGKLLSHLNPDKNGLYLDIGCGTGNYTVELNKKGFDFIGIDPSEIMLNEARSKTNNISWKIGTAEKNGLPENSVDGVVGTLTIHHWDNLNKGFSELNRVLKDGGRIVIFTSTDEQTKGYWLNHYFPKMLFHSSTQMPTLENIKSAIVNSGFEIIEVDNYFVRPDVEDRFLYSGKNNPELYFDKNIRNGISSFSALANQKEVVEGLSELRKDIDSGKIAEIIKKYENNIGDYLFIIGKKHCQT